MDKTFKVSDEDLLQFALEEAQKKGESSGYSAKMLKMEDGQDYEICWLIRKV